MIILLSITAGALFSAGLYMILRRSLTKILVGLLLLGYAVNLLLFNSAALTPGSPPILSLPETVPVADPVPQALILTAIVISFGITAFAVGLVRQVYHVLGTDDTDALHCTDLACDYPDPVDLIAGDPGVASKREEAAVLQSAGELTLQTESANDEERVP